MFTGIIAGLGTVETMTTEPGLTTFGVRMQSEWIDGLEQGASVAIDGVCLTVVAQNETLVSFQAMQETLTKTTLGKLNVGQQVNVERSILTSAEIGGHVVSGHVDDMAEIIAIETPENNHVVTFTVSPEIMKYIFAKGFVALDGASLTIVDPDPVAGTFMVWFIPETLRLTTFGHKTVGDYVNVEVEQQTRVIVDTVERVLPTLLHK